MDDAGWLAARFEESRPHLRLVAYRMLGSQPEADDAVQNCWLRLSSVNASELENLTGWLTTTVARECLKMLRARRRRREEPIGDAAVTAAAAADDPEAEVLLGDAVGQALMVVLDILAPAERVAFVLHDVFALPFDEIAPIVERSPAATRQLASRARRRVRGMPPATDTDLARQRQVAGAFLAALRHGDLGALIAVLDPDIVLRDARAAPGAEPVRRGSRAVASYALRYSRQAHFVRPALVDGAPGLAIVLLGRVIGALGFTFRDEAIIEIEMIDIPDRLRRDVAVSRDLRTSQPTGLQNARLCACWIARPGSRHRSMHVGWRPCKATYPNRAANRRSNCSIPERSIQSFQPGASVSGSSERRPLQYSRSAHPPRRSPYGRTSTRIPAVPFCVDGSAMFAGCCLTVSHDMLSGRASVGSKQPGR